MGDADGNKVHRHGNSVVELLVQRGFLLYMKNGEQRICPVIEEPIPLTQGKGSANLFNCGRAFSPSLSSLNHPGISSQHYACDRVRFSSLERIFRALHQLQHDPKYLHFPDGGARNLARCNDWYTATPCANHDCQNALRWSVSKRLAPEGVAKDLFTLIEALRNSYDLLMERMYGPCTLR